MMKKYALNSPTDDRAQGSWNRDVTECFFKIKIVTFFFIDETLLAPDVGN